MEYSRSPSPYRHRHRGRNRSSSPARSLTPSRYRYRSPHEGSRQARSVQRQNDYSQFGSRTSAYRSRARSPYQDYARYRSYSIGRYTREQRRNEREQSPDIYHVQFEDGITRVFREVARYPGPPVDPGTTYRYRRASPCYEPVTESRSVPIKQERMSSDHFGDQVASPRGEPVTASRPVPITQESSNRFGDQVASYRRPNLRESRYVVPRVNRNKGKKSKVPSQKQIDALLRGRAPRSVKQENWLREYRRRNFGNNVRPTADTMEAETTRNDQGNTAFVNGFLPIPTHPRLNAYGHPWTNQDTYQQQHKIFLEQERLQTTRREAVENEALQQRYPLIKREPTADDYLPHNGRVQPLRSELGSSSPHPLIKQEFVEPVPNSPLPWIKQESVEPCTNGLDQSDRASSKSSEDHTTSQSNGRGFWGRMIRWAGL
ncbi:hypothetical protein P171DRAFT_481469 [Karstenula rhodostoma CBS 690.94]|uniref:Uncharacterized protein n=1 Tax=Karstenula rhodostoma CBS 690.94 TaxID=1392251 RepID=A0A9P4UFD4_9PLEO|nr:hypothetical protein P171DRAFT_481469 [Karstenula rhodostoma CBS 690.94]